MNGDRPEGVLRRVGPDEDVVPRDGKVMFNRDGEFGQRTGWLINISQWPDQKCWVPLSRVLEAYHAQEASRGRK